MSLKRLHDIKRLEPEVTKIKLPKVDLIEIHGEVDQSSLLKAIPYYFLVYGANLEKLAPYIPDVKMRILIKSVAKALDWLSKYYKIKGGK